MCPLRCTPTLLKKATTTRNQSDHVWDWQLRKWLLLMLMHKKYPMSQPLTPWERHFFKKSLEVQVVENLPAASEHGSDAGLILIVTAAWSQADAAASLSPFISIPSSLCFLHSNNCIPLLPRKQAAAQDCGHTKRHICILGPCLLWLCSSSKGQGLALMKWSQVSLANSRQGNL